jgi:hypothetical protein
MIGNSCQFDGIFGPQTIVVMDVEIDRLVGSEVVLDLVLRRQIKAHFLKLVGS